MQNELVLRTGRDVERPENGVRVLQDDGSIICYGKEVVWGVATSEDVVWLYRYELCWWCLRSGWDIRMVHRSMRNDLRVADKVYIKRGCLVLEDFLFFSLYSFSWIAKQARHWNSFDSCLFLTLSIRTSKSILSRSRYYLTVTDITYPRPCPFH